MSASRASAYRCKQWLHVTLQYTFKFVYNFGRLCWQTDSTWSEESAEEDWLLRELTAVVQGEQRRVRFDPCLDETRLMKLIDDELYGRRQIDLQSQPDQYVDDYVNRLHSYLAIVDCFLESYEI